MDRDPFKNPAQQTGYAQDQGSHKAEPGPAINTRPLSAEENRGRRAPQEGSGVVIGSGASAGGGGGAEDFDDDAASGGGSLHLKHGRAQPEEKKNG